MKTELEIQVMNTLFRVHENENRPYLRKYEIASILKINHANLNYTLPRLVKRGWIEKLKAYSFTGKEPNSQTFHLSFEKSNNIPKEAVNPYYEGKISTLPIEYMKEFYRRMPNLKRTQNEFDFEHGHFTKEVTLQEELKNSHPSKRFKFLRNGRFNGRKELWEKILTEGRMKEYTFYRLVYYPFLTRKITIGENRFEKFNVPKGKKRIWFKAAKEMRNEIKDKRSSLEILFSQNKIK